MHFHSLFTLLQNRTLVYTDHTRKIELVRYLMSSYVHGKVLDTLSEHANALASSAMASLEDEADQLSHFPFLSMPCDLVLTVPRHHGWYRKHLTSCEIMNRVVMLFPCDPWDPQTVALQISAVAHCAAFSCRFLYVSQCSPTLLCASKTCLSWHLQVISSFGILSHILKCVLIIETHKLGIHSINKLNRLSFW